LTEEKIFFILANDTKLCFADETVSDLVKEATVNLLQLNPVEVSTQLMVEDFTIFRQIEATEYVDDLFEIKSRLVAEVSKFPF